ncbi:CCR4-NOT transcription complex subunit 1-like [Sipha flava]|uniref:CCR4-NOT transcription complex subunit 1 n=1 Tax=Sipha flava TaxID=143950 RepID=A0A2S2R324_9HEMI|nr:CCR4-NOT transcription complex subunit 1-like [Sipha flava]
MMKRLIKDFHLFSSYSDQNIFKMANFVGGFLKYGFISDKNTLKTIITYILYDLKNTQNANAFNFSYMAFDRFKTKLKNFSKLCVRLEKTDKVDDFLPDIIEDVVHDLVELAPPTRRRAIDEQTISETDNGEEESESRSQDAIICQQMPKPDPVIAAVADALPKSEPPAIAATVVDDEIIVPSKTVQDEIRYVINSLCKTNLETKCSDIKRLIAKEHLPWLSKYIVLKRVRQEFNFHVLYSSMLNCLNSKTLNSMVLSDTINTIKVLLGRNVGIPSMADKLLIKNLGHWLGMITLAQNKPISKDDIALEHLLNEACEKGGDELLFVVQLVTNILESCSGGNFGPNSPWTTSIINCLFELYKKPNATLQVQVEIEKLCKALKIKLEVI